MGKTWSVGTYTGRLHTGRVCRYLPRGVSHFYVWFGKWELELTAKSRRGICVTAGWRGNTRLLRPGEPDLQEEYPSMAIKKRQVTAGDLQHLAAVETILFKEHMPIVEHCALRKYEDGTDREPGWITIKVTGAAWVVQVKDPDSCMSFPVVADTLDKALDTAALLLGCDEAPWEHDVWLAKSKAEKKKK